jgi:hypothetical protein
MKTQHFVAAVLVWLAASIASPRSARADVVLYEGAGFIQNEQAFVESFDISTPGTLTVSLSKVSWLDTISNLTCFVNTASGDVGSAFTAGGTESFNVKPGMIYAQWFGNADGTYHLGAYEIKIDFCPTGTAVPVPASIILLLSGLPAFWAFRRRSVIPGHRGMSFQ